MVTTGKYEVELIYLQLEVVYKQLNEIQTPCNELCKLQDSNQGSNEVGLVMDKISIQNILVDMLDNILTARDHLEGVE